MTEAGATQSDRLRVGVIRESQSWQRHGSIVTSLLELDVQTELNLIGEELTVDPPMWKIQLRDSEFAYEVELEACGMATFTRIARRSTSRTQIN